MERSSRPTLEAFRYRFRRWPLHQPLGEGSGRAEWCASRALLHRRVRVFWGTCGPRRLRRHLRPAGVATQVVRAGRRAWLR